MKILVVSLVALLALAGCSAGVENTPSIPASTASSTGAEVQAKAPQVGTQPAPQQPAPASSASSLIAGVLPLWEGDKLVQQQDLEGQGVQGWYALIHTSDPQRLSQYEDWASRSQWQLDKQTRRSLAISRGLERLSVTQVDNTAVRPEQGYTITVYYGRPA